MSIAAKNRRSPAQKVPDGLFSGCSLKCAFCQNFPISQLGNGEELSTSELAGRMLKLQRQGVHNINFVTPTHYLPQILAALWLAIPQGFSLPLVWNSSGYEKVEPCVCWTVSFRSTCRT